MSSKILDLSSFQNILQHIVSLSLIYGFNHTKYVLYKTGPFKNFDDIPKETRTLDIEDESDNYNKED